LTFNRVGELAADLAPLLTPLVLEGSWRAELAIGLFFHAFERVMATREALLGFIAA
jgi:hypothetical protein